MKLVDNVQNQMLKMIAEEGYKADDYILNEGELATLYGVSRSTVREAVRSLVTRGYLRRVHGKGIQIVDNSKEVFVDSFNDLFRRENFSYSELVEMRHVIEVSASDLVVERATDADIEKMEKYVSTMESSQSSDGVYYNNDFDFHISYIKAAKNRLLNTIVQAYTPLLHEQIMMMEKVEVNNELIHHYHRKILEGIKARDAEMTRYAMRVHLASTKELTTAGERLLTRLQ